MPYEESIARDEAPAPLRVGPRFTMGGELGSGAFGTVYVARDHLLDREVALKRLRRANAAALYRFKQEFRSLSGLYHPNLVRMHELFSIDDEWFFTMELIEGTHFRAFVRGGDFDPQSVDTVVVAHGRRAAQSVLEPVLELEPREACDEPGTGPIGLSEERLRHALGQLALGVQALHDAGMVHRDLKPSNVLVTREGSRVKILDFGLVATLRDGNSAEQKATVSGTPAYMAPEQALAQAPGPAADWYAVGVMLYETLRGRLPFLGGLYELVRRRKGYAPADPRSFSTGLPDDLCELTMALLRYAPNDRPTGAEILVALGHAPAVTAARPVRATDSSLAGPAHFVGREAPLAALRAALDVARRGQVVLLEVAGTSGIGKTALVQHFLEHTRDDLLVLRGRCYEHESVPFKALDGIIDALTQHVAQLSPAEQAALRPRHAGALARLFPVLEQLDFGQGDEGVAPNAQEQRRRAFGALRELLVRLSASRSLVLFIDDIQWGDDDSAALLGELCSPPDTPAILLVGCARPTASEGAPRLLEEIARRAGAGAQLRRVELGPLDIQESESLAEALLGGQGARGDVIIAAGAANGSPLFVAELARAMRDGQAADGEASLGDVLAARVARLPEDARLLLELIAVEGRPIDEPLVRAAALLERAIGDDAIAELGAAQLVRASGSPARPTLETPHDRIREEIVARIPEATLRRHHANLARAIVDSGRDDPEALAKHFYEAGDRRGAAVQAELAGDRAAAGLAFDRAAAFYQDALSYGGLAADDVGVRSERDGDLRAKLAEALANAGRGVEAAECYLASVEGAAPAAALARQRCAAEQLLRSGHIDHGKRIVEEVLSAVGLSFPHAEWRALARLLVNRLRLAMRGRSFRERPVEELDADRLREIDICWSIGNGLGGVDLLRGAGFQARHLLLALGAGEPYRIARALAWEAVLRALEGAEGQRLATELATTSEEIARRIAHPHAMAWAAAAATVTAWCEGRWQDCSSLCAYTAALFRERCADIFWELGSLEIWFNLPALYFLGDVQGLARRAPTSAREAEERGDLYAATTVRTYILPLVHLTADDPKLARATTTNALASWSSEGWHLQHWSDLLSQVQIDLYEGEDERAVARLDACWDKVARSNQLRVQNIRVQANYWRARAALRLASRPGSRAADRARAHRQASRIADRLDGERHPMASALARSLELGAAILAEDVAPWMRARAAEDAFRAADMPNHADAHAVVAALLRHDRAAAAVLWSRLRETGVRAPEKWCALVAPHPRLTSATPTTKIASQDASPQER